VCDGQGDERSDVDDTDVLDDDNDCTEDTCDQGTPQNEDLAAKTACTSNNGRVCDGAGLCVECVDADDCPNDGDLCQSNECVPEQCGNDTQDPDETDVDCGGPTCGPCADDQKCLVDDDCLSGVCDPTALTCTAPACDDTVVNGDETDVDCGGSCPNDCKWNQSCKSPDDCIGGACTGSTCSATCTDTEKNASETDVDCGGAVCDGCANGEDCVANTDCLSNICTGNKCAADPCTNTTKDGSETDVDCGGGTCPDCANGLDCLAGTDCVSDVCATVTLVCVAGQCFDESKNGTETDVDCGGTCADCATGKACLAGTDCVSTVCSAVGKLCVADQCSDEVKNNFETDVDCGGGTCADCAAGKACLAPTDCVSGYCSALAKLCVAGQCFDELKNGNETDIDCGGGSCADCANGKICLVGGDCTSNFCSAAGHLCVASQCLDELKNGNETDVDCGGDTCTKCVDTKACLLNSDCVSNNCASNVCAP
jgi:hypothetical protein